MKILVLHLDGKLPNLALMKICAHHRALGDEVELRIAENVEALHPRLGDPEWDMVYGSLIFQRSRALAQEAQRIYPSICLGGTGWDLTVRLADEVEAMAPDYSGYPSFSASLGFAQRGCRFNCTDFCVVPTKEGKVRPVATLREIWRGDPWPKRVVLLDNDFFGNPNWRDLIAEARELGIAIAVIQGINARLLSDEQAAAIASVRWMADDFSRRRVYTAWDREDDERVFFRGLDRLKAHGIAPDSIMVYMLIGLHDDETHAERDYRRRKLREYGARPYPMPFRRTPELVAFQRWVIQRHDLHVPWERWWGPSGGAGGGGPGGAGGEPRKLGPRRVSLPLFPEQDS